jgi:Ca2+:H+ antiporter
MDLNFQLFETATLFITVLVVAFMLQVGFHGGYNFVQCARKNSNG